MERVLVAGSGHRRQRIQGQPGLLGGPLHGVAEPAAVVHDLDDLFQLFQAAGANRVLDQPGLLRGAVLDGVNQGQGGFAWEKSVSVRAPSTAPVSAADSNILAVLWWITRM